MPRRPSENTNQVCVRVSDEALAAAERFAQAYNAIGRTPSRTTRADVLREALRRGLESIRADVAAEVEKLFDSGETAPADSVAG